MSETVPKKRGPRPKYEHENKKHSGAPTLAVRMDPEAYDWVRSRPEPPRPYLERLVFDDKRKTLEASADKNDVPGHLVLAEPLPAQKPVKGKRGKGKANNV